jgi:membrane-bound lytic murein transglycosylase A
VALRPFTVCLLALYLSYPGSGRGADGGISGMARLTPVSFSDLTGWADDRHEEALSAFAVSCARLPAGATRGDGEVLRAWRTICEKALRPDALLQRSNARRFFETNFSPYRVTLPNRARGFLTGYYEPEVEGSLARSAKFAAPLYRTPEDLASKPYLTRAEIEAGALSGRGLELVYLSDPIEAFFVHVQGSARVRLPDGEVLRVGFAAKNGHPYTSIGKVLIDRGLMSAEEMTAGRLRGWLAAHAEQAREIMNQNRSFIFFRKITVPDPTLGPIGAAGVQLTPGRSLAVDRAFHPFGAPVWIHADLPAANGRLQSFRRLMIAQDAGSAITGAARGDIFFGSGAAAGAQAGLIRHAGDWVVLLPNDLALPDWAAVGN